VRVELLLAAREARFVEKAPVEVRERVYGILYGHDRGSRVIALKGNYFAEKLTFIT